MKNKKLLMPIVGVAALGATIAPLVSITSCKKDADPTTKVTVTFDYGYETEEVEVTVGETVSKPETPTYYLANFTGWYTDKGRQTEYNFDTKVEKAMILYAGWEVKDVEEVVIDAGTEVKRSYYQFEKLDLSKLVVKAKLGDTNEMIDVPEWAYTTTPSIDEDLLETGWQTVMVTVGDKTVEAFDIYVDVATFQMEITKDPFTEYNNKKYVAVGTTISKDDFEVKVRTTEKPDLTVTDEWTCDQFSLVKPNFTFDKEGEYTFNISYGNKTKTIVVKAIFNNTYEYDLPLTFTLPRAVIDSGNANTVGFESMKQITILDNGVVTDPSQFTYKVTSDNDSAPISVINGLIITKDGTDTSAKISVLDKNGVAIGDDITVYVSKLDGVDDTQVDFDEETRIADYGLFTSGDSATSGKSVCVIPDLIRSTTTGTAGFTFGVSLITGAANNDALELYLPSNLAAITQTGWESTSLPKLQKIYFDGTTEEFEAIKPETTWGNTFVTGVQCINDFIQIDDDHIRAEIGYDEDENVIISTPAFTKRRSNGATFQFDLSTIYMGPVGTSGNTFGPITLTNYLNVTNIEVYADGELQTNYTTDPTNGTYSTHESSEGLEITWHNYDKIDDKNMVIVAPNMFDVGGQAIATQALVPTGIEASSSRVNWKVGQTFNKWWLSVYWVYSDDVKELKDHDYVNEYIETNWDNKPFDTAGNIDVVVTDTLLNKTATFTVKVTE